MEIRYHPLFERWLVELADADETREESHPVVTSRYDMHALRRTPPSEAAPYAVGPPVLQILYAICRTDAGNDRAVVLIGGDKTALGNQWYLVNVNEAQARLDNYCRRHADTFPIVKRGNR